MNTRKARINMATESTNSPRKFIALPIGLIVLATAGFYGFDAYRYNQQYETTGTAFIIYGGIFQPIIWPKKPIVRVKSLLLGLKTQIC
ncbi:MAG: hypothetical protein LH609_09345 [Rudanella sp.]|nr:hypothetical protein [Rudanella sp.]